MRLEEMEYKFVIILDAIAMSCNRECSFLRSDRRLITMEFV